MIELYLRLAGATLVVLLPGILLARVFGRLGGAGAIVWSLTVVFAALLVTFALEASLDVALIVIALAGVGGLIGAVARGRVRCQASDVTGPGVALLGGTVFGWLLWRVLPPIQGDAPFHLGRVRKLVELGALSPDRVNEFLDGGLHPGYAFPLWHGFLALVARIADVDPALVVEHEAAVLAPLSFLVVYEAGTALFRSAWLGGAVLAAHVGLTGLSAAAGGAFKSLSLPATVGGRQLLIPAALALVFAYVNDRSKLGLVTVAAAGLVVAVVHPSYALFLLILLAGFFAARALLDLRDSRGIAVAATAFAIPAVAFFAWLMPVVRDTASHTPTNEQITSDEHGVRNYPGQVDFDSPNRYRLAPKVVSRAGAVPVAALAVVPLAFFAVRRRWAAFVLGATLVPLAVLLLDFVFPLFVDAVSLSQARRLAGFLPFAFALAGAAAVLARVLSYGVLPVALVAGFVLQREFPGDFGYVIGKGGPTLVVWVALVGGAAALAAAVVLRRLRPRERLDWLPALAALLFVVPIAVDRASTWDDPRPGQDELTPGLVAAVRANTEPGEVVLSDPETSYFVAAHAPVYLVASPPAHVADTSENRPYDRRRDVAAFFAGETERVARYDPDWVVVDRRRHPRHRSTLPVVYRDGRYVLYRFESR